MHTEDLSRFPVFLNTANPWVDPAFFSKISRNDVISAMESRMSVVMRAQILLSEVVDSFLEPLAQKAHALTVQNFGKTMQLYTPLYVSNYCENQCVYCGFNCINTAIERKKLSLEEVDIEARAIAQSGLRHILLLTGESRKYSSVEYIEQCVRILRKYFKSISLEVYSLDEDEYSRLIDAGVDGLTVYQETYDPDRYKELHLAGPKTDFLYRLKTVDRAARAGMRSINIGALLGLSCWRSDVFSAIVHAYYLQRTYPSLELSISLPRMQTHEGAYDNIVPVTDQHMVQSILAIRLCLPRVGITMSTRESDLFRDNIVRLGVTRMSAGSLTQVGGHAEGAETDIGQFDIADERSIADVKIMLKNHGYQAVLTDWC